MLFLSAATAGAVDMTNARVFVQNTGDDAKCKPQPVIAGQNPNLINPPTVACKTIQHACDIAVGIPMVHVAPAGGVYPENFVCRIAGTDAKHMVAFHIAEQVEPKGAVWMTGKPGVVRPIGEFTGSFISLGCAFCHFDGGDGDGVYVHGTAAKHAELQKTYYGLAVTHNAGRGIHVQYSDDAVVTSDTIFNNGGAGIVIENSLRPKVYSNAVFRSGSTMGIPAKPLPGAIFSNSPGGEFEDNKGLYAVNPGLELINSPHFKVNGNHVTAAGYPPFSYTISPPGDRLTDTIGAN